MGYTIAEKILKNHLVFGEMKKGTEIGIKIDQTLTQDATGTMAYLEFEKMGIDRVKTEQSVAYIDHNTLQCGFENADDHNLIRSAAKKYGVYFSSPGNGICHQVHLERFSKPGKTLIGSDSHTPTCGGLGMLSIGAGGMDVAAAMGGSPYYITYSKMLKVELKGNLKPFVTAKDIALYILSVLSVKGGVGYIIEWGGEGIKNLSVPERATITNMGAELGATTSIFPSDEVTRNFLKAQGREEDYIPLSSDIDAVYDKVITIDLDTLEPLAACPHKPDNVKKVSELRNIKVDQVCIGSCTNSSLLDMLKVAKLLKNKHIKEGVSLSISPGSKQVLTMLSNCGALSDIIGSGARLLECACGPCIGMGFSPNSKGVSLRTFNRNFEGRSGTKDANVYLVSPETAVASALTGYICDPRELKDFPVVTLPDTFLIDDTSIIPPASVEEAKTIELIKGPNIGDIPDSVPLKDELKAAVSLKVGDHITTDHIMPAGAKILPFRSNIPKLSEFCFNVCDTEFSTRAKEMGNSFIIGGVNYGQGSSREHAALVPLYLGVRVVIAKSFARIHAANLINVGIIPLTFKNTDDYDKIDLGDILSLSDIKEGIKKGSLTLVDETKGEKIELVCSFTERQLSILDYGGLLSFTAKGQ
ncbi:MAG: aconitate hydratase [Clostridia bacterium]|nr:aconitate hydratase [Clostridia bacterium]